MKWWLPTASAVPSAEHDNLVFSYYSARWEVWSEGELVVAGDSAGKTVFANGADGIWDGHGIVKEAQGDRASLIGRRTYETGPVIAGLDPPVSYAGRGMFVIL